jgi:hypothetical protein
MQIFQKNSIGFFIRISIGWSLAKSSEANPACFQDPPQKGGSSILYLIKGQK